MVRPSSWCSHKQRRRLSNLGKQLVSGYSFHEKVVDEYPEPAKFISRVDLHELRESVKSIWRKRLHTDQIKTIIFAIPNGQETPTDYQVLSDGNHINVIKSLSPAHSQCVFYELESGYQKNGTSASDITMFNEFIIDIPEKSNAFDQCPITLNSVVFC
ncbi:hypothetical protein LPJ54_001098 [Coemansia sp. RSA 1824]|nr:hypothetical protein LPJ54_001098 [Coemansia sp. RSA 1824]